MNKPFNSPTFTIKTLVPQRLDLSLKELNNMPEKELRKHIELVRLHLVQIIGLKHPPFGSQMSEFKIKENLKALNRKNGVTFISPNSRTLYNNSYNPEFGDGLLKYSSSLTKGINHWFFEMWLTNPSNGVCPLSQFYSSEIFYRNLSSIIKDNKFRIFERKKFKKLSSVLDPLRITNGASPAFNFSSALAKWIYLNASNRLVTANNDFYVLDSSAGWGGRLGGILAASNHSPLKERIVHYCCTDVNSTTHNQFSKVENYWKEHINPKIKFELYKSLTPAEILLEDPFFSKLEGKFDLALTSPPYFATEQYSQDENQSYLKYPNYDIGGEFSWKNGFLKKMIETTFKLLKPNGEFWINISDVNNKDNLIKYPVITLESDTLKLAKEAGFRHILTYKMVTPNIYSIIDDKTKNSRKNRKTEKRNVIYEDGKEIKFEPIFVFKKDGI